MSSELDFLKVISRARLAELEAPVRQTVKVISRPRPANFTRNVFDTRLGLRMAGRREIKFTLRFVPRKALTFVSFATTADATAMSVISFMGVVAIGSVAAFRNLHAPKPSVPCSRSAEALISRPAFF
jgi:hypothetical protein